MLQIVPVVRASRKHFASHFMASTLYTNPHSIILYQETVTFISTAVRTLDLNLTFFLSFSCYSISEGTGFNSINGQHPDVICGCRMEPTEYCSVLMLLFNPACKRYIIRLMQWCSVHLLEKKWANIKLLSFWVISPCVTTEMTANILRVSVTSVCRTQIYCDLQWQQRSEVAPRNCNHLQHLDVLCRFCGSV
jgi:hypothetical protein